VRELRRQVDDVEPATQEGVMGPFPYRTATSGEIEARARGLLGKLLVDIDPMAPMRPSSAQTKGVVGRIYESAFDIPANSIAGPDFPGAGIELKSVPILVDRSGAKAKERISVGMIDFVSLVDEEWERAAVRKKLDQLLLIFYGWKPYRPISSFETLAAGLWRPDERSLASIRSDWELIRALVRAGRRDEVSESLTTVLGAATKGAGHGSRSRAWSLKQPYVTWLYETFVGREVSGGRVEDDPRRAFEAWILALLQPHVGRRIDAIAADIGRAGKGGKAAAAETLRALVGERAHGRHGDFERFGIEVKTVPVNVSGRIWESMSFPAFVHEELTFETWEDSDLLGRLNRLLILPIIRGRRASDDPVLGRPFFWNPTEGELQVIAAEWERFRSLIESGQATALPTASQTQFIHVRPKARDSRDRDIAPGGFSVIRKCFWLNQRYLERVLAEHDFLPPGR
jgi:DNA mismatch repair endonuclease MutH